MSHVYYSDCSDLKHFTSVTPAVGNSVQVVRDSTDRLVTRLNISSTASQEFGLRKQLFRINEITGDAETVAIRMRVNSITFTSPSNTLTLAHIFGNNYTPASGLAQLRIRKIGAGYGVSSVDPDDAFNTLSGTYEIATGAIITIIYNVSDTVFTVKVVNENGAIISQVNHTGRTATGAIIHDINIGKFFSSGVTAEIDILDVYFAADNIDAISTVDRLGDKVKYFIPKIGVDSITKPKSITDRSGDNIYSRDITIAGTGSLITNYIVPIIIDTTALISSGKMNENCSDLIIRDQDYSELDCYLESPNTTYTTIWVKIPIFPGGGKTLRLSYGNPAFDNNSNVENIFPIFNSSKIKVHLKANENIFNNLSYPATGLVERWDSSNDIIFNENFFGFEGPYDFNNHNSGQIPSIVSNQLNGYPVVRFDGVNDYLHFIRSYIDLSNREYEVFAVEARNSGTDNVNYIIGSNIATGTNTRLQFGYRFNGTFRFGQGGNDIDYTIPTFTTKIWRMWNGVFDNDNDAGLGGSGHYLRLNGATVASNTNTTAFVDDFLPFVGGLRGGATNGNPTNFYNGDIAEVIIAFDNFTASERSQVDEYLQKKYDLNSTNPVITFSSETFTAASFDYKPKNILTDSLSVESRLPDAIFGVANVQSDIKLKSEILVKPIIAGNALESWSNSTYSGARELRRVNYTTATVTDTVHFARGDVSDPSNFGLRSLIFPNYDQPSSDSDIIEQEIYIDDYTTLDLVNTKLQFRNASGTLTYTSAMTNNLMILDTGYQFVRIKKSDFIKSGVGEWTDTTHFDLIVKGTATGAIYHGNYKLRYNFNDMENEYIISTPVCVGLYNSNDAGETWSSHNQFFGRITENSTNNEINFKSSDYLSTILENRLVDFAGFPDDFFVYEKADILTGTPQFYNGFKESLEMILSKIFPTNSIDIDTNFDSTGGSFFKIFNGQDKFGDLLKKYSQASFGIFSQKRNGDIRFRSAAEWLLSTNAEYTITGDFIKKGSFKSYLGDSSAIVNRIVVKSDHNTKDLNGLGNWSLRRQRGLVISSGGRSDILEANNYTTIKISPGEGLNNKPKIIDNLILAGGTPQLGGWLVGPNSENSDGIDNTLVRVESYYYNREDNTIDITFYNQNSSDRYVKSITCVAHYIPASEQGEVIFENKDSIKKYGLKEVVVDTDLIEFFTLSNTGGLLQSFYQDVIQKLSEPKQIFEFEVSPTREIEIGDVIKVDTELGSSIIASVIFIREDSADLAYSTRIKCIRLDS